MVALVKTVLCQKGGTLPLATCSSAVSSGQFLFWAEQLSSYRVTLVMSRQTVSSYNKKRHSAAAQSVDVIYDVFKDEVVRHIRTPNPVTGRDRHVHLTMHKFTVAGVQRQAVNMRLLDLDGTTKVVHGTTAVIRRYDDPVPIHTATLPPSTVRECHQAAVAVLP